MMKTFDSDYRSVGHVLILAEDEQNSRLEEPEPHQWTCL